MLRTLLSLCAAALLSNVCQAQTITFTHQGSASGTLGGAPFAFAPFTITAVADVSLVQPLSGAGFSIDHTSASIDIVGVGSVDFITMTRTFVNHGAQLVGFSRATLNGADLFNGPSSNAFASWDLVSPIGPVSGTGSALQWTLSSVVTTGGDLVLDATSSVSCTFTAFLGPPTLGANYCTANVNSTGQPASISAQGSNVVAMNDVTLMASDLPQNSFGLFITSRTQGFVQNPGGSFGNLCLAGQIGRFVGPGQVQNSGAAGAVSLVLDLTQHPTPTGFVAVAPGETWNFQAWFRDTAGGNVVSDFSDGLSIAFQ